MAVSDDYVCRALARAHDFVSLPVTMAQVYQATWLHTPVAVKVLTMPQHEGARDSFHHGATTLFQKEIDLRVHRVCISMKLSRYALLIQLAFTAGMISSFIIEPCSENHLCMRLLSDSRKSRRSLANRMANTAGPWLLSPNNSLV